MILLSNLPILDRLIFKIDEVTARQYFIGSPSQKPSTTSTRFQMILTGGSNKFFLLDRLSQLGDGLSVHLHLQFGRTNVPEKTKIFF